MLLWETTVQLSMTTMYDHLMLKQLSPIFELYCLPLSHALSLSISLSPPLSILLFSLPPSSYSLSLPMYLSHFSLSPSLSLCPFPLSQNVLSIEPHNPTALERLADHSLKHKLVPTLSSCCCCCCCLSLLLSHDCNKISLTHCHSSQGWVLLYTMFENITSYVHVHV